MIPVILAHGALGPLDEIIFIGVAVIFIGMMGLTWFRSQSMEAEETDGALEEQPHVVDNAADAQTPDHFKLD